MFFFMHHTGMKTLCISLELLHANLTKLRQSCARVRRETKYSWFLYLQLEKALAQN